MTNPHIPTAPAAVSARSDYMIKKLLRTFYEHVQACLAESELKQAWRVWLTTPAAYLTFAVATFNEVELAKASKLADSAKGDVALTWIASLIEDFRKNPTQEMLSLKEMHAKHGAMYDDPEEAMSISDAYAAKAGYVSPDYSSGIIQQAGDRE